MSEEKQPFNPSRGLLSSRRGGAGGKAARLPSLRTPRDLTLGGVQKKTFAPNIPARRKQEETKPNTSTEKQTGAEVDKKKSHIGIGLGTRGTRATRGRRYEKRKADVVQSHSIFEQGPTEKSVKPSSTYVNYGDTERSSTGKRTTIKKERPEDKETKQLLDDLLRDDFIVDDKIKTEDPSMAPVRLPLSMNTEVKVERDVKPPIKTPKVKEEQNGAEGMVVDPNVPVVGDEVDIPSEQTTSSADVMRPRTCAELFSMPAKSEEGQLVFIQLPDTLPGEPLTKAPVEKVKEEKGEKPDTKSAEDKLAEKLGQVGLSDFNEGHIGKLQVLKSGRTRLLLGNNSLDVTLGTPAGFLQELVSVRLDGKTGDMCVLGHVNHKLVCLPDMESLLDSR